MMRGPKYVQGAALGRCLGDPPCVVIVELMETAARKRALSYEVVSVRLVLEGDFAVAIPVLATSLVHRRITEDYAHGKS